MGYWLYGKHSAIAALNNKKRTIHKMLITKELKFMLDTLKIACEGIESFVVNHPNEIDKAIKAKSKNSKPNTFNNTQIAHQGIALYVDKLVQPNITEFLNLLNNRKNAVGNEPPKTPITSSQNEQKLHKNESIIILDGITDPSNIGGIFRIAAAFNFDAIISTDRHSPEENGTITKVACGTFESTPFIKVVNLAACIKLLKKRNYWILGLTSEVHKKKMYDGPIDHEKIAIVVGSESKGLRQHTLDDCDILMTIPVMIESLNAVTATAIAGYIRMQDVSPNISNKRAS